MHQVSSGSGRHVLNVVSYLFFRGTSINYCQHKGRVDFFLVMQLKTETSM